MPTVAFNALTANTLSLPTPGAVSAAIPLFLIALLVWQRKLPRVAALLALLAGAALRSGWLYVAIHHLLGWATRAVNATTGTVMGGAVPGGLAIVMLIVYITELKLDREAIQRLTAGPRRIASRRSFAGVGAGLWGDRGYVGGAVGRSWGSGETGRGLPFGRGEDRPRKGWPDKLLALAIGLMLPSVVGSIPGSVGTVINSVFNVVGGLLAGALAHTIGIR